MLGVENISGSASSSHPAYTVFWSLQAATNGSRHSR